MVSDRVAELIIAEGEEFAHGFTYSGHPASCAVALANINLIRDEKIIENVRNNTGPYLQSRWRELAEHPLVGEARGVGFIGALELVKDKSKREFFEETAGAGQVCRDHCFNNGLIMRAVGDTMIISPPLIMNKEQIDELVSIAAKCLDLTARDLGIS